MSVELMQKDEGIHPLKLLLLALSATKFLVFIHVVDGNTPPSSEVVEADVKRNYAAGGHQLDGQGTGDAFPHAAVRVILPECGKATILCETSKELEQGSLLLLSARSGYGEKKHKHKAERR
nr:unnamed protein product [Digitaria exilis]